MVARRRLGSPATGFVLAATIGLLAGLLSFGHGGPVRARAYPVPLARSDRVAGIPLGVFAAGRARRLLQLSTRQHGAAQLDAEAEAVRRLVPLGYPLYCGGGASRVIALTFDDGPSPNSELFVALLRRAHMQGTFFLVGRQVGAFPRGARAIAAGNAVGDHTWTHAALSALHAREVRSEIVSAQQLINTLSGLPVLLFRPPYGLRSRTVDRETRRRGMLEVLWTIDDHDYKGLSARAIARRVLTRVRPGAIVLLHETQRQTLPALTQILRGLRRRGLESVTLPILLTRDPPSLQRLRAGFGGCGVRP